MSPALPIQPAPLIRGPFAPTSKDASPVRQIMVYTGSPRSPHATSKRPRRVELSRYAFLLSVAPPRIHGLSGVPVNPLALF
ncbi:MAG: hypothetical protein HOV96_14840 [Nonomuraea sp.]|nr:hypothetical protein [Nonomuraea sp.]NUP64534.1 hypothetical protein [Nonomuraea sp.]NUP78813.1 hypothetical protein [Nonomuraea sp.]